jgi:lauroyl/myristoyl acyltransferase
MQKVRRKFAHNTVGIIAAGVLLLLLLLLTPSAFTTLFLNNLAVLGGILFGTSA